MKHLILIFILSPLYLIAQKKPLDHSVYDNWQSIGERVISNNGQWVIYTVTPQEGDASLFIRSADGRYKKEIPRGYGAMITQDSKYAVFKIRPLYKETRQARIKKRRPEEFPRDSVGLVELGKEEVIKSAKIKSFKMPEKSSGWVAWQKEREQTAGRGPLPTQKTVDSLRKTIDSLTLLVTQLKNIKGGNSADKDAEDDPVTPAPASEGSDLFLRNLKEGKEKQFKNVVDYYFSPYGQKLLMRISKPPRDSAAANAVVLYDLEKGVLDTILKGGNDFKNFSFSEDGTRVAFVAERDSNAKALQKFYGLYLHRPGDDTAFRLVDRNSVGMEVGMTVSENGTLNFSKSGRRLFFGTSEIQPPKDTTLIDIDLVKVDIWHYKDDYLQSQQLSQLNNESRRNYLAVYDLADNQVQQLGSKGLPNILQTAEGDGNVFYAITDTGRRVESQWSGQTRKDIYALNPKTGALTLIKRNHDGQAYPSATGKYIILYDNKVKHFFAWDGSSLKNITSKISTPLFNEDHDTPDDPNPYGIMGWHEGDSAVYVYDRYDVWKVDPRGIELPKNITIIGRKNRDAYRYIRVDPDEKFLTYRQPVYFRVQNNNTKENAISRGILENTIALTRITTDGKYSYGQPARSKNSETFIYTKENYTNSPDIYVNNYQAGSGKNSETKLSDINPQQSQYNWGTAELYKWKAFDGTAATGILYKPEDFDSTRRYPMIIYFYERLSDGLFNYVAPSPTPSRLNISFFVSRGYLVFAPDIRYTKGHPGKDAYNYIVSGAQALGKNKWVDSKNIGIQGQSWGGYQVAYLITATDMFKAAWAGAPVVNMFSAYGGIRWETGNNRQFQYEKGQSRIGATPWDRPDLYIENSPFFHLKKVKTPLVIMSNDADGAVPWYQGIEFFTAMRRLGKPVWLLNYNGEAHNLVERKNRKDIQVREQQYFDWLLKGEKPAKWITEGVPAVKKGKEWGLEL